LPQRGEHLMKKPLILPSLFAMHLPSHIGVCIKNAFETMLYAF
jgi:hypothetical protein